MRRRDTREKWLFIGFLGILFIFYAVLRLLDVAVKNESPFLQNHFPFFVAIGYHTPSIVLFLLLCSITLTVSYTLPRIRSPFSPQFFLTIFILWIASFPLGNPLKDRPLFYEDGMENFAFWIVGICLSVLSAVYLGLYRVSLPERVSRRLENFHRFLTRSDFSRQDGAYLGALSLWVFVACSMVNAWVFDGIPHVYDEIAQLFQANVFAQGWLTAPAPSEPQFFERMYIPIEEGRWYSIYPPGYSLLLALGVLAGKAQWINPLISAFTIPLYFYFASCMASLYAARLGSLFLSLSPFFLVMGGGYMNHPACLLALLLFLIGGLHAFFGKQGRRSLGFALLSGGFAGWAFLIRPLTGIAFLLAGTLAGIARKIYKRKGFRGACFLFLLGMVPAIGFFLVFNQQTTGSPWITGYEHYFDANPMGFGEKPWGEHPLGPKIPRGEYHTPLRGLANTLDNANALNAYLFGWPVPSLFFAILLFAPGLKRQAVDWFCLAIIGSICSVYFFYFFQDVCFGPRFLYETIPLWILLSVRGIEELSARCESISPRSQRPYPGYLYPLLALYFAAAMGTFWIERIAEYSDSYWGTREELADLLRAGVSEKDAVILVEDPNDHLAVFSFLDPRLDRGWIVAHDLGEKENHKLLRHYPEWPVYRLRLKETETTGEIQTVLERAKRF